MLLQELHLTTSSEKIAMEDNTADRPETEIDCVEENAPANQWHVNTNAGNMPSQLWNPFMSPFMNPQLNTNPQHRQWNMGTPQWNQPWNPHMNVISSARQRGLGEDQFTGQNFPMNMNPMTRGQGNPNFSGILGTLLSRNSNPSDQSNEIQHSSQSNDNSNGIDVEADENAQATQWNVSTEHPRLHVIAPQVKGYEEMIQETVNSFAEHIKAEVPDNNRPPVKLVGITCPTCFLILPSTDLLTEHQKTHDPDFVQVKEEDPPSPVDNDSYDSENADEEALYSDTPYELDTQKKKPKKKEHENANFTHVKSKLTPKTAMHSLSKPKRTKNKSTPNPKAIDKTEQEEREAAKKKEIEMERQQRLLKRKAAAEANVAKYEKSKKSKIENKIEKKGVNNGKETKDGATKEPLQKKTATVKKQSWEQALKAHKLRMREKDPHIQNNKRGSVVNKKQVNDNKNTGDSSVGKHAKRDTTIKYQAQDDRGVKNSEDPNTVQSDRIGADIVHSDNINVHNDVSSKITKETETSKKIVQNDKIEANSNDDESIFPDTAQDDNIDDDNDIQDDNNEISDDDNDGVEFRDTDNVSTGSGETIVTGAEANVMEGAEKITASSDSQPPGKKQRKRKGRKSARSIRLQRRELYISKKAADVNLKPHECHVCMLRYGSQAALNHHMNLKHSENSKTYPCPECSKVLGSPGAFKYHMNAHKGTTKKYQCEHCDKELTSKGAFIYHMRTHENAKNESFTCNICGLLFRTKKGLKFHCQTHSGDVHNCPECDKQFSGLASLQSHMKNHMKPTKCTVGECELIFRDEKVLQLHMRCHDTGEEIVVKEDVELKILPGEKGYGCSKCSNAYSTFLGLKYHWQGHDMDPTTKKKNKTNAFPCPSCEKVYTSKYGLIYHQERCSGALENAAVKEEEADNGVKKCPACSKCFVSAETLKSHMEMKHQKPANSKVLSVTASEFFGENSEPAFCEICGVEFCAKTILTLHQDKEHNGIDIGGEYQNVKFIPGPKPYSCIECGRSFKGVQSLSNHFSAVHKKLPAFHCEHCGEEFLYKIGLTKHLAEIHNELRPCDFKCEHCPKSFPSQSSLDVHLRIHTGEKPFECNICSKRFMRKDDLKTHMSRHDPVKRKELSEKRKKLYAQQMRHRTVECGICHRVLSTKSSLRQHMRTHTGERPFTCDICGKTFRTPGIFKEHHRMHTGEKPIKCPMCDKRFRWNTSLKSHMAVHVRKEDNSFQCEVCARMFPTRLRLTMHTRVNHTVINEEKFKCTQCGKVFGTSYSLNKHMDIHAGKK